MTVGKTNKLHHNIVEKQGDLKNISIGEEESARTVALAVHPCSFINGMVRESHLSLPVPFSCEPLALVFAAILVCEHTLTLSLAPTETTPILQSKFALFARPVRSKAVLMIILKFPFVLIAIFEK